ncbi:MAG: DUF4437 domain-containing protein, partial [Myxococcota bacterium]
LLRPVDGFRSPPHIHNVSYRAVVIRGLIHNDAPEAKDRWMAQGAYWTQAKGAVHITAAQGPETLAYIEIDEGPYLVWPVDRAFEADQKSRNIDAKDIAWTSTKKDVEVAALWGDSTNGGIHGSFFRIPPGFQGTLQNIGSSFRGVLVAGAFNLGEISLKPGAYFDAFEPTAQRISCEGKEACIVYTRTKGAFDVNPGSAN